MSGSPTFRTPWKVAEKQHTPILTGLRTLVADQEWEVEVIPLVVGQRSVEEKEWLKTLRICGIGKEDRKRIIDRLGYTLLNEYEKIFGSYWWQVSDRTNLSEKQHTPCPTSIRQNKLVGHVSNLRGDTSDLFQ
jgi:hypothetical protein